MGAVLLLSACQTTGGLPEAASSERGAAVVPPVTGAGEPAERAYSFFYTQGSHLKDLIEAGQPEQASLLYKKHQAEFFDPKKPKFDALLDSLAGSLDDRYRPRFEAARSALLAQPASTDPATWPAARAAVLQAQQVLEAFAPHEALASGPRRSRVRDALAETRQTVDTAWRAIALEAFEKHDIRSNFFKAYPVTFDDQALFTDEAFIARIESKLRAGGKEAVLAFAATYTAGAAPSPLLALLQGRLGNLYVELALAATPNTDRLKTALIAVAEAEQRGLTPTEVPGMTIAFVEVTSQTLLKEGQIEFPVAIEVDLPFKTVKTTLDEALGGSGAAFDYVIALEVNMAKSLQRAQNRAHQPSQFLSGHREVSNPAYEPARMAVYQAQSAVSSNSAQHCQGYGCLGKAIAGVALAVRLKGVNDAFAATPMTLTEPVYQEYQFSFSDVNVRKAVTASYYIVDVRQHNYFKSVFDVGEEKQFRLAYNLHEKDKNLDTHLKAYDKEESVKRFDELPATIKLSDVLAQFSAKGRSSQPFQSLMALRGEMLLDKNKALAEHRQRGENQAATTQADPRFDSVVVVMNPKGSIGTGFFVEPDLVLTNYHVIEGTQFVEMKLRNGLETFGKVIKSDVRLDLALIRAQSRGRPVAFHSGAIPLGATVEAIGHPKGLEFSITRGVVSALRKQPSLFGVGGKEVLFVQTDTPVNPGNSGGPLFLNGQVVAVNDNKFSAKGIEGIAFSVHYTEVQDFLSEGF
jgi:S1-C subfamily serine protease